MAKYLGGQKLSYLRAWLCEWGMDKWVPKGEEYVIPTAKHGAPSYMMVKDLIDLHNSCWDRNILEQWFDENSVKSILSLPLSYNRHIDNLFWWKNKCGVTL